MQRECNSLLIQRARSESSLIHSSGCIIEPTHDIPNGLYLSSSYCAHRRALKLNETVSQFIVGRFMKELLCALTDSESIFLFNEQFIAKPSNSNNTAFRWHQDAEYLTEPRLYISVWIPIDDIVPRNGSIFMVPFDHSLDIRSWRLPSLSLSDYQINELQSDTVIEIDDGDRKKEYDEDIESKSNRSESENTMKGENRTKEKGTLNSKSLELLPSIGDMVIFSSFTFHKSNSNQSDSIRRVMMTQYSTLPIIDRKNKKLARLVVKM